LGVVCLLIGGVTASDAGNFVYNAGFESDDGAGFAEYFDRIETEYFGPDNPGALYSATSRIGCLFQLMGRP
jgi:hypothetical protein